MRPGFLFGNYTPGEFVGEVGWEDTGTGEGMDCTGVGRIVLTVDDYGTRGLLVADIRMFPQGIRGIGPQRIGVDVCRIYRYQI